MYSVIDYDVVPDRNIVTPNGVKKQPTIYGNSSEDKPLNFADGTIFIETDTQDIYMFNEDSSTWSILSWRSL